MAPEPAVARSMSYAEYLALQESASERLTWVAGEVFAMAGGSIAHARLIAQAGVEVALGLRGSPCRAVFADQRVRVVSRDISVYPDIAVVCGPAELAADDPHALVNPTAVIEVLSPSTEAWDRGGRFHALRELPALQHYALVSQDRRLIEVFTRNPDDSWTLRTWSGSERASLPAIGVELALDAVYDGVIPAAAA